MSIEPLARWVADAMVRPVLERLRPGRSVDRLVADWDAARLRVVRRPRRRPPARLLVVPSDAESLIGSLGDDAMIESCVAMAREREPTVEVHVLVATAEAANRARERGWQPEPIWRSRDFPAAVAALLDRPGFDAVVALGADIMDGHYGLEQPTKAVITSDLAARSGASATILGFSFNETPRPELRRFFAMAAREVNFHVRDDISLARFRAFSPAPAKRVTDGAFLLPSGPVDAATVDWIAARRAAGRRVVGMNLHPRLAAEMTPKAIAALVERAVEGLLAAAAARPVAWLLLPHDYRAYDGDGLCLDPIFAAIRGAAGPDARLFEGRHSAATLKGVAGLLDGVATGRMHLAIAALGMGAPVLGVTYQGKFEGLFRHFDLPDDLLVSPEEVLRPGVFAARLIAFVDRLDPLRRQVAAHLPAVLAEARRNFEVFDPPGGGPPPETRRQLQASAAW